MDARFGQPMTKPLLAILLLLPLSVSAEELDGKAIFCTDDEFLPIGFEFSDGIAIGTQITTRGTRAVLADIETFGTKAYITSTDKIIWWDGRYHLDRQTLLLEYGYERQWKRQCYLTSSPDDLRARLNAAKDERQREIDEQMKDNKI